MFPKKTPQNKSYEQHLTSNCLKTCLEKLFTLNEPLNEHKTNHDIIEEERKQGRTLMENNFPQMLKANLIKKNKKYKVVVQEHKNLLNRPIY